MLFFLYGAEDFLALKKLRRLENQFRQKYPTATLDVFDVADEQFDFNGMVENFHQGGGLFSQKRMLVVKNVFLLPANRQQSMLELIKKYAKDKERIVVFFQKEIKDKKGKLYKFILKESQNWEFKKLDAVKMKKWLEGEIQNRSGGKVKIESGALERLTNAVGNNLWLADGEIEKLIGYKTTGSIKIEDVKLLCAGKLETKIFDLIDAVGAKNKSWAHESLRALLGQGENAFVVFSMISSQFRNLLRVQKAKEKYGFNQQLISQKLQIHPFVVKKCLAQLNGFSLQNLKETFQLIARLDHEVKIGQQAMDEALIYLICKI